MGDTTLFEDSTGTIEISNAIADRYFLMDAPQTIPEKYGSDGIPKKRLRIESPITPERRKAKQKRAKLARKKNR